MSDINITVQDEIVNIDIVDEPVLVNVVNSPGVPGAPGVGVPVGGTTGQVLAKNSNTNYDTEWVDVSGGVWGTITGTLSNQTDLQNALNAKVPYTGATTNVDLGTHRILAQHATIASSGSGDTATINHSSGSGIALNISKGGSGEGLYINKTSGSGNAATIIGTLNATTLVKSGGTSSQFLKADGSVDSTTYVGGSGASGQVAYWNGTTTQTGSNNLYWDYTNNRLGIGTNTPSVTLDINGITKIQNIRIDGSNLDNTFIGRNTWAANTGTYNSFIGSGAGNYNTSGYAGTFLGYNSGSLNTTGVANTFLGYQSGFINTTGTGNTFIGVDAGYKNVASNYSVIIGFHAGLHADVSENVLIGADTAQTNGFSGQGSVYVGYRTGFNATTANYNTLIGSLAGFAVTTGDNLILIGREAGQSINTGSDSTIIGYRAGFYQTSPDGNTMVGSLSGFSNTTGNSNSYIGKESAYSVTTGNNNTIFGYRSGYYLSTGSDNTFIGALSGSSGSQLTTATNSVAIGYNSFTTASNQVVIGNVSTTHNILYGNLSLGAITNTGQVLQVTGTTLLNGNVTFSSATGMTWDATNSRLGIGTNAPAESLHINGTTRINNAINLFSGSQYYGQINATSNTFESIDFSYGANWNGSQFIDILGARSANLYRIGNLGFQFFTGSDAAGGSPVTFTEKARIISSTGNLLLQNGGTFTDSGERLQVTGNVKIVGSGATSATNALLVQNSSGVNLLQVVNDRSVYIGVSGLSFNITTSSVATDRLPFQVLNDGVSSNFTVSSIVGSRGGVEIHNIVTTAMTVNPTSGSAQYRMYSVSPTINQTGGANGITRGLYVNPTLTAAADWRAIEVSSGGAYINTTSVQASAILQADSTTKGFLPPRMTNAQRTAISSPAVGLIVYCTDMVEGLYVYKSAGWTFVI
jgi:hypothetical protein